MFLPISLLNSNSSQNQNILNNADNFLFYISWEHDMKRQALG
jgi:hypothetical protein